MKKNGFTLIELMITIAIVALLAAVAMPKFTNITEEAKVANVRDNLSNFRTAISMFYIKHGVYPTCAAGVRNNIRSGNNPQNIIATNTLNGFTLRRYYDKDRMPNTPRGIRVQPAANAVLNRVLVQGGTFPLNPGQNSFGWRYRVATGDIRANLNSGAYGQNIIWRDQ